MKYLSIFLLVISVVQVDATEIEVSLDSVAKQVLEEDFTILQNAERVYQAKEAVQVARMNLLPKLNLWKIVSAVVDLKSSVGLVEDIVPFLVPNNWFRAREQELFYQAEKTGMRALKGNQILNAKALYLQILMDERLLSKISESATLSADILAYTKLQEQFGGVPIGTSSAIEIQYLGFLDDEISLKNLVFEEKQILGLMVGIPANSVIKLVAVVDTDISSEPKTQFELFKDLVLERSPEIEQFGYIITAARSIRREVWFSFIGVSSLSRGVMGGIFDQYPTQPGLGFGLGPSVRIVKSQKNQLELQQKAAGEVLLRQLSVVVENLNREIDSFANVKKRVTLAHEYYSSMRTRLLLGESVPALELMEALKAQIESAVDFLTTMTRFQINQDRLKRMKFEGDYQALQNEK